MNAQLSGLLLLTFRELRARKIVIALFVISTLAGLVFAFAPLPEPQAALEALPADLQLRQFVLNREAFLAGAAYWGGTLLVLFAAAPLFAGMIERGRIELLLSKPLPRTRLLVGHLSGVLLVMLLLTAYVLGGVWLVLALKTGVWNARFLLAISVILAMFAVLYALVVLVSTWTESTALALITAYGLIFLSLLFWQHEDITPLLGPGGRAVFLAFYYVLPDFGEVTDTVLQLAGGEEVASWGPFISSLLFGVACYLAAAFSFNRRDF